MTSSVWCHTDPWRHRSCDHSTQCWRHPIRPQKKGNPYLA